MDNRNADARRAQLEAWNAAVRTFRATQRWSTVDEMIAADDAHERTCRPLWELGFVAGPALVAGGT